MDSKELLQWAAQLGTGGILAGLIFVVAWRELKKLLADAKDDKKILIDLVSNVMTVVAKNSESINTNTRATDTNTATLAELRRELRQRSGS